VRPATQAMARVRARVMLILLKLLSVVVTAAMMWVGGGIIIHGPEGYGLPALGHAIHAAAEIVGHAVPAIAGLAEWAVSAVASGLFGLLLGAILIPFAQHVVSPVIARLRARSGKGVRHHS